MDKHGKERPCPAEMARRARELCGASEAERNVIEAADKWCGYVGNGYGGWIPDSPPDRLEKAILALRAQRQPKPRYEARVDHRIGSIGIWDNRLGEFMHPFACVAALNAAESK